jgi:hypothetical protein|tara:strand:+ start:638 stop:862 length:225 start_codon:yes stop_codon:yes gene_type:complete
MQTINNMTESDLYTLKENYINHIIDGMDIDTLCAYAFDAMMNGTDGISQWDEVDVTEEIKEIYDEELLQSLMPT